MNVQAALDAGVSPNICFDDFDTEPLSNLNDEDIDIRSVDETIVTDTTLQRFLLKSLRPRCQILRRMNGVFSEISYNEVYNLNLEISNACKEINKHVKKGETDIIQQNFADLLLRRFLISLHRPWASKSSYDTLYYFSRKTCLDSALTLLSPLPNEEFSHLVLIGSGIFKNCIIHLSLALAAELTDIEESGRNYSKQLQSYRQMLINALKESCW